VPVSLLHSLVHNLDIPPPFHPNTDTNPNPSQAMFVSKISAPLVAALFCLAPPAAMAADGVANKADKATLLKIKQPVGNPIKGLVFSFYVDNFYGSPPAFYVNTTFFKVLSCPQPKCPIHHIYTVLDHKKHHTRVRLQYTSNLFTRTPPEPTELAKLETQFTMSKSLTRSLGQSPPRAEPRAITSPCRMCPCSTKRASLRYLCRSQALPPSLLYFPYPCLNGAISALASHFWSTLCLFRFASLTRPSPYPSLHPSVPRPQLGNVHLHQRPYRVRAATRPGLPSENRRRQDPLHCRLIVGD